MKKILGWIQTKDRNEITYWVGLLMLFIGLAIYKSIPLALTITGGAMALESVLTSYLVAWINERT